jgi:hypothetical protein
MFTRFVRLILEFDVLSVIVPSSQQNVLVALGVASDTRGVLREVCADIGPIWTTNMGDGQLFHMLK